MAAAVGPRQVEMSEAPSLDRSASQQFRRRSRKYLIPLPCIPAVLSHVQAHVPLASLFGYIGSLRALSSGRASFAMQSDHYAAAPAAAVVEMAG